MSFIFDATKAPSPERQQLAQAIMRRKQMQQETGGVAPMPTDIGGGLAALGEGIAGGLEDRHLMQQATAPTDAWADMRTQGQSVPNMNGMGGLGGGTGNPFGVLTGNPFKRLFG